MKRKHWLSVPNDIETTMTDYHTCHPRQIIHLITNLPQLQQGILHHIFRLLVVVHDSSCHAD